MTVTKLKNKEESDKITQWYVDIFRLQASSMNRYGNSFNTHDLYWFSYLNECNEFLSENWVCTTGPLAAYVLEYLGFQQQIPYPRYIKLLKLSTNVPATNVIPY